MSSKGGPYRSNAIPASLAPSFREKVFLFWEHIRAGFSDVTTLISPVLAIVTVILVIACMYAAVAGAIQYVVIGFTGKHVGTFWHYFVGLLLFNVIRNQARRIS